MGYKSFMRSANASANAARREADKRKRQVQREAERIRKKVEALEVKRAKILDALKDLLAKGKIDGEEYKKLLEREVDITFDLLVFGKTPAVSASKRYICGKIGKEEFDALCEDIVPTGVALEREEIAKRFEDLTVKIKDFVSSCVEREGQCSQCGKQKSLFSPIKEVHGLKLCGKCKKELNALLNFKGMSGSYFYVNPQVLSLAELDDAKLEVNIQQRFF